MVDKVFKTFDSYQPDTKANKLRFREFFGFAPPADVTRLYAFGDELGIDSKYQFAFVCDSGTKSKIVAKLGLVKATEPDNFGANLWYPFPWWDSVGIITKNPYKFKGQNETYKYMWYDESASIVYYSEFDL